ncbi:MAG: TrbC/VirB2 family protein [Rickettsiales bacterium]|nr:TrbC/VirB2 family protein [Rickettsiales bacterium]
MVAASHHWTGRLLAVAVPMLPFLCYADMAFAAPPNTAMGNVLCTVAGWFTGNAGKGLEALVMTILGITALMGKVTWGKALVEGAAAAVLMEGMQIVDSLNAGSIIGCPTI